MPSFFSRPSVVREREPRPSYNSQRRTPPNTPPPSVHPTPSIQSVSADNITKTTARAVVNIADHDGTALTVKLR